MASTKEERARRRALKEQLAHVGAHSRVQTHRHRWDSEPPIFCLSSSVDPAVWKLTKRNSPFILRPGEIGGALKPERMGIPQYAQFWRVVQLFGTLRKLREFTGLATHTMKAWALTGLIPMLYRPDIEKGLILLEIVIPQNLWDLDEIVCLDPKTLERIERWPPAGMDRPFLITDTLSKELGWQHIQQRFELAGVEYGDVAREVDPTDPVAMRILVETYLDTGEHISNWRAHQRIFGARTKVQVKKNVRHLRHWSGLRTMAQNLEVGSLLLAELRSLQDQMANEADTPWPLMKFAGIDPGRVASMQGPSFLALLMEMQFAWLSTDITRVTASVEARLSQLISIASDASPELPDEDN